MLSNHQDGTKSENIRNHICNLIYINTLLRNSQEDETNSKSTQVHHV
jgi:hypothetical protein